MSTSLEQVMEEYADAVAEIRGGDDRPNKIEWRDRCRADAMARIAKLEAVAEAADELTRWDWLHELHDGAVADDVRKDVAALEAALKELDDEVKS